MSKELHPYGRRSVQRGLAAFIIGRGASGVLTLLVFALAARLLSLGEYGHYAAALALMELGLALAGGGVDWVTARIVPEYRIHAGGRATARMVLGLAGIQFALLLLVALLIYTGAAPLAALLKLDGAAALFGLTAWLVLAEGVGRLMRDQMLGVLMAQRAAQASQLLRVGSMALLLGWAWHSGMAPDAVTLLQFELAASGAAATAGVLLLAVALWRLRSLPAATPGWQAPARDKLVKLALQTYSSYLLSLLYGPQVLTMMVARFMGADAVAVFGFARVFADQVRRYLPTDLFQSIVRPTLTAYYASTQDFAGLSLRLGLLQKAAVVVLFPLLVFFSAFGELGMAAIGGVRYAFAWPVLVLLLCGAGTTAWRRVSELACNTVLAADIGVRATMVLVVMPPVIALALYLSESLLLAVGLVVLAECVFCLRVLGGLAARGYRGAWDRRGFLRLLLGGAIAIALLLALRVAFDPGLPAALLATGVVALAALRLSLPLSAEEGALVADWNARLARLIGAAAPLRPARPLAGRA